MSSTAKHLDSGGSPASSGWLSSLLHDLSGETKHANRRRLVIAAALAVALVEIAVMLIPAHTRPIPEQVERVTVAKITRIERRVKPTPKPTPRPTPKPTPKPVVHTKVIAETHVQPHIVKPGAPAQKQHVRRVASARPLVHTKYHSKPATIHVPVGGHGAGTSTTAKAETGGAGPGGTGTGESGTGQGTGGAPAAHEPCGFVDFMATSTPIRDRSTGRVWENIEMIVHFPDASQQSVDLDYTWFYPNDMADPWSDYNEKHNPDAPTPFQFPPPDKAAGEPPLVQYVMQHTTRDGFTLLRDCPK